MSPSMKFIIDYLIHIDLHYVLEKTDKESQIYREIEIPQIHQANLLWSLRK